MDTQNNTHFLLGRIEGKIDSFTQKLSEHAHRIDAVETSSDDNARKIAVHDERLKSLEGKPSLAGEVSAINTKLAYYGGGLAVIALFGPYLVKTVVAAL